MFNLGFSSSLRAFDFFLLLFLKKQLTGKVGVRHTQQTNLTETTTTTLTDTLHLDLIGPNYYSTGSDWTVWMEFTDFQTCHWSKQNYRVLEPEKLFDEVLPQTKHQTLIGQDELRFTNLTNCLTSDPPIGGLRLLL